jgi:hypothetical protein
MRRHGLIVASTYGQMACRHQQSGSYVASGLRSSTVCSTMITIGGGTVMAGSSRHSVRVDVACLAVVVAATGLLAGSGNPRIPAIPGREGMPRYRLAGNSGNLASLAGQAAPVSPGPGKKALGAAANLVKERAAALARSWRVPQRPGRRAGAREPPRRHARLQSGRQRRGHGIQPAGGRLTQMVSFSILSATWCYEMILARGR